MGYLFSSIFRIRNQYFTSFKDLKIKRHDPEVANDYREIKRETRTEKRPGQSVSIKNWKHVSERTNERKQKAFQPVKDYRETG